MSDTNSLNPLERTSDAARSAVGVGSAVPDVAGHPLFERLGVGGMGEVYRCGDDALGRDLALKVLRSELRGNADAEERFLREARLTGSLQHPGVVPIHNLSRLTDGRPCYTMKLVRGRTFADRLRDEPEGPERLPRLLAVVEKVCQAMAFAHSRSVIHRDLKPANVMVGEFGEVQVMDWGLAKEIHAGAPATEPADGPPSDVETVAWVEDEGLSRAGSALGTPAYMPPEQAAGDWPIVDERADVFALGAMLCEILTGQPPYQAPNRDDVLRRARRGDLAAALGRLERCGAEAALVQLCRECLAPEREGRPRNAEAVAKRLAAYQAEVQERLRRAEVERAAAQVKAQEERKRRRLTLALAALVLLVVLGVGGGAWWQQQQRAKADQAVSNGLAQAELLAEQARADPLQTDKYHQALEAARVAAQLAESASADVRRRAEELIAQLRQEEAAARKDRELLAALLDVRGPREGPKYRPDDKGMMMAIAEPTAEEQFASAFRAWGLDVDTVPAAEAAAQLKRRSAAVVTEVIAALDEWASQRLVDKKPEAEWRRLTKLAAALDDDPGSLRRELRDILARRQLPVERALGMLSAALRPVPLPVVVPLGEDHRQLRQLAEKIDPASEPVLGLLTLTRALRMAGEEALAEWLLRAALTARPREVVLYHTLGQLLAEQKPPRWAEAVEFYRAARTLRPDLGVELATALRHSGHAREGLDLLARMVQERPDSPDLHFQHGFALGEQGKLGEEEAAYRKAIALKPDFFEAYYNLGIALGRQGKSVEAEAAYRQAIALKPDDADAYIGLGITLRRQGKLVEAEAAYRKAIALKPDDADVYYLLGNALGRQRKHAEEEAAYRKAIALKPDDADAYKGLGIALDDQGKHAEAEAAYRKVIALKPDDADAYILLGLALNDQEKYAEAEAAYRKAIALKPDYAKAYYCLGISLGGQEKLVEAEAAWRKAIALKPDYAEAYNMLGIALDEQRRYAEAEAAYRKVIALKPDDADAYKRLGGVLQRQGRFTDSLAALRRGHELGSKRSSWRYLSLQWVPTAERLVVLEKKLPAIHQGEAAPADADEAVILAWMCQRPSQKQYAASARLYGDAFAADPELAANLEQQHRYNATRSAALAAAGQGKDARLLPDKVAGMFRRWALSWLRDDLMAYEDLAAQNNPAMKQTIQQRLTHWRSDPDLASVRDPAALDLLPDNERAAWQALWRDVDGLAKRVTAKGETKR